MMFLLQFLFLSFSPFFCHASSQPPASKPASQREACPKGCDVWFDGCKMCPCMPDTNFKCDSTADDVDSPQCAGAQHVTGTNLPYCFDWKTPEQQEVKATVDMTEERENQKSEFHRETCFLSCFEWTNEGRRCPCLAEGRMEKSQCVQEIGSAQMFNAPACNLELLYNTERYCPADNEWPSIRAGKTAYIVTDSEETCKEGKMAARSRVCSYDGEWAREMTACHSKYCPADKEWGVTPSNRKISEPCPNSSNLFIQRLCDKDGIWQEADSTDCMEMIDDDATDITPPSDEFHDDKSVGPSSNPSSFPVKWIIGPLFVVSLLVAGYFGYSHLSKYWQQKETERLHKHLMESNSYLQF